MTEWLAISSMILLKQITSTFILLQNEKIELIQYIRDKSNGIFLLAVLQLENAKTKKVFLNRLNGFSDASET